MAILNIEARPANPDQLILRGDRRNPPVDTYFTYLNLTFWPKGWSIRKYFGEHVIGNLRAGRVVNWVLRVPWCHAREFGTLTRITFPDLQQLLLALVL
jgi:hypothetical protein